jgi:hypothetical protein
VAEQVMQEGNGGLQNVPVYSGAPNTAAQSTAAVAEQVMQEGNGGLRNQAAALLSAGASTEHPTEAMARSAMVAPAGMNAKAAHKWLVRSPPSVEL